MPKTAGGGLTAESAVPELPAFGRRKDYTHQRIAGRRLKAVDLRQSLFIGALIENCRFEDVDFSRCDFSGTKVVRCTFSSCKFGLADIRSSEFAEVEFESCDFRASHWSRTRCRRTGFLSARFERATVLDSGFSDCRIEDCGFRGASVTSVEFERSRIDRSGFADCTALFLFFEDCRFGDFVINAESIGYTFGLSARDVERAGLVHLGRRQAKPSGEEIVSLLLRNYSERKWYVGMAALALNFKRAPALATVRRLVQVLGEQRSSGLPLDVAELHFFVGVLERLRRADGLPLAALWLFDHAVRTHAAGRIGDADQGVGLLIARIDRMTMSMLDQAVACLEPMGSSRIYELRFGLDVRPSRPLDALLEGTLVALQGSDARLAYVSGHEGSWVEIWQVSHDTLFTIELLLFMAIGGVKTFEEAFKSLRKSWKGVTEEGSSPHRPAGRSKRGTLPTLREGPIGAEIDAVRSRALRFSTDAVIRVDAALTLMAQMSDDQIAALEGYGLDNMKAITVKPVRKSSRKAQGSSRDA